jgi:hypothetical protein
MTNHPTRREFSALALSAMNAVGQVPGQRPTRGASTSVLNPCARVPVSLIIDDSTCLANLAHFGIPHFHEMAPERYPQDWRSMPREIPDSFVRKFGEWCHEHGVKGKYSVVPNPACVGWVDRDLPGWSRRELLDSIKLVRDLMLPDWDIHPEMVTHTWVIDTKTGRPFAERTAKYMEIADWSVGKSADELTNYLAYALQILKNAGLPCEGITTPGGFGGKVLPELAQAVLESCRYVYQAEIPHYFRHGILDGRSVLPRVEYASGIDGPDPRCVVSVIACTGDWFGGWDAVVPGDVDRLITANGQGGRMPEVIRRGEPAVMACHWPGIYFNGTESGFKIFQEVVRRLHATFDHLIWMKNSEIARYWAAKELTSIFSDASGLALRAPYACPQFTVKLPRPANLRRGPSLAVGRGRMPLTEVSRSLQLKSGTWTRDGETNVVACFDLPKGDSRLEW